MGAHWGGGRKRRGRERGRETKSREQRAKCRARTGRQAGRQRHSLTDSDKQIYTQTDRQAGRQKNRQSDGQRDKQTKPEYAGPVPRDREISNVAEFCSTRLPSESEREQREGGE